MTRSASDSTNFPLDSFKAQIIKDSNEMNADDATLNQTQPPGYRAALMPTTVMKIVTDVAVPPWRTATHTKRR